MKILLIYPRWDYPTLGELQEPLGLLYLQSALEGEGHQVDFIDLAIHSPEEMDRAAEDADLAGISSSTVLFGRALRVLERLRKKRPDLPVVLGGPHPTVRPEEALAHGFTAAVRGEGEHTARAIVHAFERGLKWSEIPGVAVMEEGKPRFGPERKFEPELDRLPRPKRDPLIYQRYKTAGLRHAGIMATRGCPWNCLFCKPMQNRLFGRKVRKRSPEQVAEEMKQARETTGMERFLFRDDTLMLCGREWFRKLEQSLQALAGGPIYFSCQARVDQVEEELLELMKRCGLQGIAFGVESGSQKVLDFYRKGITVEQTLRAFALCRRLGIGTHAFIMLGAPVETRQDLELTVRLVEQIQPDSISVSITTPAPGTDLYDYAKELGLLAIKNPEDADYQFNQAPLNLPSLTSRDLAWAERALLDLVPTTPFRNQMEERLLRLEKEPGGQA